jgi:hypothetical protein
MSRLVLQPRISRAKIGIWVDIAVGVDVGIEVDVEAGVDVNVVVGVSVKSSVGVIEDVSVRVGETGMMITVDVADGMNRGVGERIAGRGDGEITGVVTDKEIFPGLQVTSNRANAITGNILIILILLPR